MKVYFHCCPTDNFGVQFNFHTVNSSETVLPSQLNDLNPTFHHSTEPPVIEPFNFPSQVQDTGRAQVTCSISAGDLPMEIVWSKDGRPIDSHLNVECQTGEFHSLLIFKTLRGDHSGVYTCTARNVAATASHSATLLVQGNDSIVKESPKNHLQP